MEVRITRELGGRLAFRVKHIPHRPTYIRNLASDHERKSVGACDSDPVCILRLRL